MPDTLTLLGHTSAGNLIFETHDNTQYVCEQPVPGTAVWKNQNGNLHRAGKLSTVGPEFVLDRTACKCCGLQSSCHVCRSTDAAFETDFQTAGIFSRAKSVVGLNKHTNLISEINKAFAASDIQHLVQYFCDNVLLEEQYNESQNKASGKQSTHHGQHQEINAWMQQVEQAIGKGYPFTQKHPLIGKVFGEP